MPIYEILPLNRQYEMYNSDKFPNGYQSTWIEYLILVIERS